MTMTEWDALAAGRDCPFDFPRPERTDHWEAVATLPTSTLYLPFNQTYRGHGVLVFDPRHATRLDELTAAEWGGYAADLQRAAAAIVAVCRPDHLNVESLGNLMPHLHWHIVPRYKHDPRWGTPIWAADLKQPDRRLGDDDRVSLLAALRAALRQ
jgi:diadenosine tetraphosphate (Ap4A) HIT family hydrolase